MGAHVAETVVKLMLQSGIGVCNSRVLILGLAFKENCPDLRNTRVVDIIDALREYSIRVDVYDPWIDRAEAQHEYGLHCLADLPRVDHLAAEADSASGHRTEPGPVAGVR